MRLWLCGVAVLAAVGCAETRRELGEECLRDEDCLSERCVARACSAPPPVTSDRPESPPAPVTPDAGAVDEPSDAGESTDGGA